MKKIILLALCIFGLNISSQAQSIADNAIGVRVGNSNEISYQRGLSGNNRLELDLGFHNGSDDDDAFVITGIYQWLWNLEDGFNWYVGAGAGVGFDDDVHDHDDDEDFLLRAVGNIGIEYNFDFPLLLSLDFRPEIDIINDGPEWGLGLGIRYQF